MSHLQSCSHYINMQDQMTENLKSKANLIMKISSRRNGLLRSVRLEKLKNA